MEFKATGGGVGLYISNDFDVLFYVMIYPYQMILLNVFLLKSLMVDV